MVWNLASWVKYEPIHSGDIHPMGLQSASCGEMILLSQEKKK